MITMRYDCDVLIVGAGPAGCSAAIACQLTGLRTVLLERSRFPRPRPGETLHPGIEPLLRQLGVLKRFLEANFLRFTGIWIAMPGVRRFERFGGDADQPWTGYQACRDEFDALLLARAAELGVEIMQPCRALAPIENNGRIVGVRTTTTALLARVVIDATGASHWLARKQGIALRRDSAQLIARYGYASACRRSVADLPLFVSDPRGWLWLAQVKDRLFHWAWLSYASADAAPYRRLSDCIDMALTQSCRGADVSWRIATAPAGAGYLMIGDAASVVDPAASHGVLKAIMSGITAAYAVKQSIAEPGLEPMLFADYGDWLYSWYRADVEQLSGLYHRADSS